MRPLTFLSVGFLALVATLPARASSVWDPTALSLNELPDHTALAIGELEAFEGRHIRRLTITGNLRTAERAIRDLLRTREGDIFSARHWLEGVKRLYNTTALYDIRTAALAVETQAVDLTLTLKDKWTLLPYATFQGGGGDQLFGVGFYDVNFGGYFSNLSIGGGVLNSSLGYDINLYQEWFLDTDWVFGLDFSLIPANVGTVTLLREMQQLLTGRRLGTWARLNNYLETYVDSATSLPTQRQWRVRPAFIVGRSNLTNYLEDGYELTAAPVVANVGVNGLAYAQLVLKAKRASILYGDHGLAGQVALSAMSSGAPQPYQLRYGGFDTVRGFGSNRFFATSGALLNLEFRPKLVAFRWGFIGLDLIAIHGALFTDWAAVQGEPLSGPRSLVLGSVGAGLRFNFVKIAGAIVRLDFAQTLTPSEGWGFSFGVGQLF